MLLILAVQSLALRRTLIKHFLECWLVDGLVSLVVQFGDDLVAQLGQVLGVLPQFLKHACDSLLGGLKCAHQLLLEIAVLLHLRK